MAICIILFILMELSGGSTNSQTLLKYGANLDVLVKMVIIIDYLLQCFYI